MKAKWMFDGRRDLWVGCININRKCLIMQMVGGINMQKGGLRSRCAGEVCRWRVKFAMQVKFTA